VLQRIRWDCPDAVILLLAILPCGEAPDHPIRLANQAVNEELRTLADGTSVVFEDYGSAFVDERGNLRTERMPDLLHPNALGYQAWAEQMEGRVAELLLTRRGG
jgi:beta-glucosidase